MRIQAICGQDNSATTYWMKGIQKYSRHQINIQKWHPTEEYHADLIHFNYGRHYLNNLDFVEKHPEIAYSVTIMGPADLNRIAGNLKDQHLSGIIALGSKYEAMIKQVSGSTPVYNLDAGVDTTLFTPKPPPRHFVVGCAFDHPYPFTDSNLERLLKLRFPLVMCGEGMGTYRDFQDMPWFYDNISVLVENDLVPSPGGLTPLEAGAVGRPTIASRQGNIADWFPDEFLVDSDEQMIQSLRRMRDDPEFYEASRRVWLDLAKARSWETITTDYDSAFDSMINLKH